MSAASSGRWAEPGPNLWLLVVGVGPNLWGQECVEQVPAHAASEHGRGKREVLTPPAKTHQTLRTRQATVLTVAAELHVACTVSANPLRPP
eukprot:2002870-Rhodomonas_salina.1